MSLQEAKQFVALFIAGDYTPEEYEDFLRWLKGATAEDMEEIADAHEALQEEWAEPTGTPSPEWVAQMERKLDKTRGGDEDGERGRMQRIGPDRMIRRRMWIAAASVIILLSSGVYLYVREDKNVNQTGANPSKQSSLAALLTTFTNPRGGEQKQIQLADGSKVWLNASSTLKYPAHFDGKERVVQLSGEAFFEVTRNSTMPFRVLIKDAEVEVLGTDFNVMAYEDESISRTTLIAGAVRMESGSQHVTLQPGQQAEIPYPSPGGVSPIKVISGVSPDAVLAWKNGLLQFESDNLYTIMRTLSRVYNVDIQADPTLPASLFANKRITGNFSRADGLSKILEQLESQNIHFTRDGKKIKVTL